MSGESPPSTPVTLFLGLAIILASEAFLVVDVRLSRRGAIETKAGMMDLSQAARPAGGLAMTARFVAINMTPLAWLGYVIFLEGVLTLQGGSPARRRPNHLAMCALASVIIWCVFDAINFYCFHPPAWTYIGLPLPWWERYLGYAIAFAAILPGMLMSGQVLMNWGIFDWARSPAWRMPGWLPVISLFAGAGMFLWPVFSGNAVANLTLWTSLVFMLDPINLWLGRPSMFRDWQAGWYGRTLAGFAGGLLCGLLWEFWNYWAMEKWIYHLPFLGAAENIRYFQMPLPGLLGFIPFGMECWIMWQTMRIPFDGLVEGLGSERELI